MTEIVYNTTEVHKTTILISYQATLYHSTNYKSSTRVVFVKTVTCYKTVHSFRDSVRF